MACIFPSVNITSVPDIESICNHMLEYTNKVVEEGFHPCDPSIRPECRPTVVRLYSEMLPDKILYQKENGLDSTEVEAVSRSLEFFYYLLSQDLSGAETKEVLKEIWRMNQ